MTAETTPFRAKPSASLADFVWAHMAGLYGHTWTSAYGDNSRSIAGAEWARTLAGLTRQQVEQGIDACRAEGGEWPPSAPRFRAMCLGIPSFATVQFEIATPGVERSLFTRSAWQFVDGYAYRLASSKDAVKLLRDAYERARDLVMRGHSLPAVAPAAAIADDTMREPAPASPERAKAALSEIAASLGINDSREMAA